VQKADEVKRANQELLERKQKEKEESERKERELELKEAKRLEKDREDLRRKEEEEIRRERERDQRAQSSALPAPAPAPAPPRSPPLPAQISKQSSQPPEHQPWEEPHPPSSRPSSRGPMGVRSKKHLFAPEPEETTNVDTHTDSLAQPRRVLRPGSRGIGGTTQVQQQQEMEQQQQSSHAAMDEPPQGRMMGSRSGSSRQRRGQVVVDMMLGQNDDANSNNNGSGPAGGRMLVAKAFDFADCNSGQNEVVLNNNTHDNIFGNERRTISSSGTRRSKAPIQADGSSYVDATEIKPPTILSKHQYRYDSDSANNNYEQMLQDEVQKISRAIKQENSETRKELNDLRQSVMDLANVNASRQSQQQMFPTSPQRDVVNSHSQPLVDGWMHNAPQPQQSQKPQPQPQLLIPRPQSRGGQATTSANSGRVQTLQSLDARVADYARQNRLLTAGGHINSSAALDAADTESADSSSHAGNRRNSNNNSNNNSSAMESVLYRTSGLDRSLPSDSRFVFPDGRTMTTARRDSRGTASALSSQNQPLRANFEIVDNSSGSVRNSFDSCADLHSAASSEISELDAQALMRKNRCAPVYESYPTMRITTYWVILVRLYGLYGYRRRLELLRMCEDEPGMAATIIYYFSSCDHALCRYCDIVLRRR
jgi:hypothetical protein